MHPWLDEQYRELIEGTREFARAEILPRDRDWDTHEQPVTAMLPTLGEMGFMSLRIPAEYGGLDVPRAVYCQILHELAYASPSVSVTVGVHNMVGELLARFGPQDLRSRLLPAWGAPEHLSAFAISEPDAGSDPASIQTTARQEGDHWIVNGAKMWITNGLSARWLATLVRTDPQAGRRGLTMLWIDASSGGVERQAIKGKTGIRGSETAALHFQAVSVPASNIVGGRGEGLRIALAALNGGRLAIASQATGIAQACLDEMIQYARTRQQFGQRIADFQAVRAMIADSATELEAARALVFRAAEILDRDGGFAARAAAARAKLFATEAANRIAYRAVQVHGGAGYVNETRVERLARDARVTTIYEGTSEIQRLVIARELAQEPTSVADA